MGKMQAAQAENMRPVVMFEQELHLFPIWKLAQAMQLNWMRPSVALKPDNGVKHR
jgi:hypothetical protein